MAVGCVGAPGEKRKRLRRKKGKEEKCVGTESIRLESYLPASLLEKSKLQCRPLQHSESCDRDWPIGFAGEAAL